MKVFRNVLVVLMVVMLFVVWHTDGTMAAEKSDLSLSYSRFETQGGVLTEFEFKIPWIFWGGAGGVGIGGFFWRRKRYRKKKNRSNMDRFKHKTKHRKLLKHT